MNAELWSTVGVLAVGVAVVVGGVLWLRLHAFLALTLAALLVASLTPLAARERYEVKARALHWEARDQPPGVAQREAADATGPIPSRVVITRRPGDALARGTPLVMLGSSGGRLQPVASFVVDDLPSDRTASAVRSTQDVVSAERETASRSTLLQPLQPGRPYLLTFADYRAAKAAAGRSIGSRVALGFGETCGKIGILIAMAAIIGKCLLDSGAADRIVRSALRLTGERGAPLAFLGSGFLLGIPVFFDTVFYLMIPLGKALYARLRRNYLLYVLSIVCGATMAHSLVPPTPGPLFVAEQLGVDLGTMIIAGTLVGAVCSLYGYLHARLVNRWWELPLRESPEFTREDLQRLAERDEASLPPLGWSLAPIVLPVFLIGGATVARAFADRLPPWLPGLFATLGDKNIALSIAAAVALGTLAFSSGESLRAMSGRLQAALASGGVIILITAAGGAFGTVLKQTDVAGLFERLPTTSPVALIVSAFLITTAVRTAQGSATVAMITAVGVLSGVAASELPFHPVYLALAIGCGSKPIAWMNDSGFWVIARMSGMTEAEALRFVTPMTAMMGVVGLLTVLAAAIVMPLTP